MRKLVLLLVALCFGLTIKAQVNLQDGLVAFYPFNGNANDESGNGNNGSIYGATLSYDRNGKPNSAYRFDGYNNYIKVNDSYSFNLSNYLTISVWVNIDDFNKDGRAIIDKENNAFNIAVGANRKIYYQKPGITAIVNSSITINSSNWYHIVAVQSGSHNAKLFINGNNVTNFDADFAPEPNSRNLLIGAGQGYFKGQIDDIRIYNRALNENEIQALYKEQTEETINPPAITWENPNNYNSNTEQGTYKIKACIKSKKQLSTLQIYINNSLYRNVLERGFNVVPSGGCDFVVEQDINLSEGNNQIKIIAANQGGSTTSDIRTINYQAIKQDNTPPTITLTNPQVSRGFKQIEQNEQINILGKATDESGIFKVTVNGTNASVSADGIFQANVLLAFGDNTVTIKATDTKQNTSEFTFYVNRKSNQVVNNVVVNVNNSNNVNVNINERRIALVIGNGDYISAPLRNPVNDANTISTELKKLGFEVTTVTNGSQNQMKQAISNYGTQLSKDKNIVGLFYYAGHGIQVKGKNYIIPTDAKIEKEPDVEVFCVDLDGLLANLEYAGNNMNVIILDACRNNPFGRGFRSQAGNGLATVNAPTGTFIAFATAPGSTAADGDGNNGLYTQEFVKALQIPNIKIEDVFKKVRTQVKTLSNGQQIPWENSSIEGDFYFKK